MGSNRCVSLFVEEICTPLLASKTRAIFIRVFIIYFKQLFNILDIRCYNCPECTRDPFKMRLKIRIWNLSMSIIIEQFLIIFTQDSLPYTLLFLQVPLKG